MEDIEEDVAELKRITENLSDIVRDADDNDSALDAALDALLEAAIEVACTGFQYTKGQASSHLTYLLKNKKGL